MHALHHDADTADTADTETIAAQAFITRWSGVTACELATAQSFVIDLCALLGLDKPHPTPEQDYMFERPVTFLHGDGSTSPGRIDCYRRGHFVLEAKKFKAPTHTKGFDDGLLRARSQAEGCARALPATEGRPPFLLVVDVGTVIEVYAEFSQSGATYTPYPDPRSHRLQLTDLARPEVRERLCRIWTAPHSLDPARISAQVTREVAALLARLSQSLEASQNPKQNTALARVNTGQAAPEIVANYLTRCLFSMFAEDVGLLPAGAFQGLLQTHRADPATLQQMLRILWADMDRGGFCAALAKNVLHFNGKLFKGAQQDHYSLLLSTEQIDLLIEAARANWREVEPAIFGTLLERALDPTERHALGAHYTPRAYVERLVLPTVITPLRREWADARAAALAVTYEADALEAKAPQVKTKADFAALDRHQAAVRALRKQALQHINSFLHRLCTVRVLDPACGSANFLYVTLEHLKRLEGEVHNQLDDLGHTQDALDLGRETVTLQQLRGIELNERAAALAELVLWIGYLQWHIRARGNAAVAEPVVHNYGNIECRDAVLAWDALELAYDDAGQLRSRWDGRTFKAHPVTGEMVPDEAAQVPQWHYRGARRANWPQADFIVGNPPFIGKLRMREALGDGYVEALRGAWPAVPESADFVMYWWHHAAQLVGSGQVERMGLITTNSLTMIFNRRVVQAALEGDAGDSKAGRAGDSAGAGGQADAALILPNAQKSGGPSLPPSPASAVPCHLEMAIPDHPWVDSANGAAVRIAMTVLAAGIGEGVVQTVTDEKAGEHGEMSVQLSECQGLIHADLKTGVNVTEAQALHSNAKISSTGVIPHGAGMLLTPQDAAAMEPDAPIKPYRNGKDLTDKPRNLLVIDCYGLTAEQLRDRYPRLYQWLIDRVKPERDVNNDKDLREKWWLHRRNNDDMRRALAGLSRYIGTVMTAKHRVFQFLDGTILPDQMIVAIALDDAYTLGVLSSQLHIDWALATGGTLEDRPRYNKSRCFETFPFPDADTGLTDALRSRIAHLAEHIDTHRKRVLGLLPSISEPSATDPALGREGPGADFCAFDSMRPPAPPAPARAQTEAAPAATPAQPGLTLTGLYNVLQALREGRPLNAKEKTIHTHGLVGVLRELHDELDAAVRSAYGLGTVASTEDTLAHLVALNAQRAAEEAAGRVRWLRPAFQNPAAPRQTPLSLSNQELQPNNLRGLDANLTSKPSATVATQPWPATLPEQVRAVAAILAASPTPLPVATLEAHFKGRGPWKKGLPLILDTLAALGRARGDESGWRG